MHVGRTHDRTLRGHELAGHVRYGVLASRDGGQTYKALIRQRKPLNRVVRLKGSRVNVFVASVCDANGNCALTAPGPLPPVLEALRGNPSGPPATR